MKKVFGLLLAFSLIAINAFAVQPLSTFGTKDSTTYKYSIEAKSDGVTYFRPSGGFKYSYEKVTTSDTLVTAESGRTYHIDPTSQMTINLPTATVGARFRFVAVNGHANGTKKIIINPADADIIRGIVTTATTMVAGDSAISPGTTGDTLELECAESGYWDVTSIRNTWVDNN
jgi:hypothetical protein